MQPTQTVPVPIRDAPPGSWVLTIPTTQSQNLFTLNLLHINYPATLEAQLRVDDQAGKGERSTFETLLALERTPLTFNESCMNESLSGKACLGLQDPQLKQTHTDS